MARSSVAPIPPRVVVVPPRVEPPGLPRWARRMLFGGVLAVLITLVPVLGRYGFRAALEAEGERAAAVAADPSQPGYQAVVTPTATMLVMQRDAAGALVGAVLMASSGGSGGGAALLVPATTVVTDATGQPALLVDVDARDGTQATADALGRLFRLAFGTVVSADPLRWSQIMAAQRSLALSNPDELSDEEGNVIFESGDLQLSPSEVGVYLAARGVEEDERGRVYRQQLLWQAWMASLAQGVIPGTVSASGGEGALLAMAQNLAAGPHDVLTLPVTELDGAAAADLDRTGMDATGGEGEPVLGPPLGVSVEAVRRLVAGLVPLPTSYEPGDRIRVKLLDGAGDSARALGVATVLVPAGAEITVFGNADRFDYETSSVRYIDPAQQGNAATMAAALGVGSVALDERGDPSVDVTVIVGRDLSASAPPSKLTVPTAAGAPATAED